MTEAEWTTDLDSNTYKDALTIRHDVFVVEQKVPMELEVDSLEDQTDHIVLYHNDEAVATARIYNLDNDTYKVQRVATLKKHRGQGYGKKLMQEIEQKVKTLGGSKLTLGGQNTALAFYEKLGYQIESDEFMDAGIPHHTMVKYL